MHWEARKRSNHYEIVAEIGDWYGKPPSGGFFVGGRSGVVNGSQGWAKGTGRKLRADAMDERRMCGEFASASKPPA